MRYGQLVLDQVRNQPRLVVAGLVLVGCTLLTFFFATLSSRVPRYSDLVVVSGEIDPSQTFESRGGKSGALIRVRLVGEGELLHNEGDLRYTEVADALRTGGHAEAWVTNADAHSVYPARMWQLRHNGQMVFTYQEAVAFRTGPQATESILLDWGLGLMMIFALLRPRRASPDSHRTAESHPSAQLPERLWGIGIAGLFVLAGIWQLYHFSETHYSPDLLIGLLVTMLGCYLLFVVTRGGWKPRQ